MLRTKEMFSTGVDRERFWDADCGDDFGGPWGRPLGMAFEANA